MAYKELKDYFPDGITGNGIFTEISTITWFPGVNPSQLDTYFMLKHGDKLASKICENFADSDGHITGAKLTALAGVIHNAYIKNWEHEYKTLTVEYNPIENTDYVETYSGKTHNKGDADTTPSGKVITEGDVYGFNSSTAAHDTKGTQSYDNYKTESGFENNGTDEHEIRKHGNIGVTTNAQMIVSDLEAWKLNNFYDILCSDICKMIALSIF